MGKYQLNRENGVVRTIDRATLPARYINGALVELDPASLPLKDLKAWLLLGNVPDPADPIPDPHLFDRMEDQVRALAMLLRIYTNQTRSGNTTQITNAQLKADFKAAFDSLQ